MEKQTLFPCFCRVKTIITIITTGAVLLASGTICFSPVAMAQQPPQSPNIAPIAPTLPNTKIPSPALPNSMDLEGNSPFVGRKIKYSQSEQILRDTIIRLESFQSFSAEISLQINLFGDSWQGTGKYEELISRSERQATPSDPNKTTSRKAGVTYQLNRLSPLEWTRFRLHVKMLPTEGRSSREDTQENILEIVCDLRAIWTYTLIEGTARLTQLNIEDLANALNRLTPDERKKLEESGVERPCGTSGLPGLGGLAGLLKRLLVDYQFQAPPESVHAKKGNSSAWAVTGILRQKKFDSFKDYYLGNPPNNRFDLLETIPTHVVLYIGKESPFPFHIQYNNNVEQDSKGTWRPSPKNNNPVPIFSIDYGPVLENPSFLQPKNFVYGPPPLNFEKVNDEWLRAMIPGIEL